MELRFLDFTVKSAKEEAEKEGRQYAYNDRYYYEFNFYDGNGPLTIRVDESDMKSMIDNIRRRFYV